MIIILITILITVGNGMKTCTSIACGGMTITTNTNQNIITEKHQKKQKQKLLIFPILNQKDTPFPLFVRWLLTHVGFHPLIEVHDDLQHRSFYLVSDKLGVYMNF